MARSGIWRAERPSSVLRGIGVTIGGLLVALIACLAVLMAVGEATRL